MAEETMESGDGVGEEQLREKRGDETDKRQKQCKEVARAAAELVRESNALVSEDVLTLTKTYPTCNALLEQQEIRIHSLMKRLMRKAGTGVLPPKLETAEMSQFVERTIEATDNLCGDIHVIIDALEKAQRDQIVRLPKQIIGAESTRKTLTPEDKAAAIRRIATNFPSLLAHKMRQKAEELKHIKATLNIEKPQKKYGFAGSIDNSETAFKTKLRVKHHARQRISAKLRLVDEDEGRTSEIWQSDISISEHPYALELEHFVVPEAQLRSREPIRSKKLEEQEVIMINTKEDLERLVNILNKESEFAVDLEAHSERSFLGLTCLLQLSTRSSDFIVDPFPLWEHMHLLNEPFTDPSILKVFHGGSSDCEWLQRDFGVHVVNMFDTYWAAKKLEYGKFSLQHIVSRLVGVHLDKRYQLADWRIRPLSDEMLLYARQDTHYLLYCYDVLREELLKKGPQLLQSVYDHSKTYCLHVYVKPCFDPEKCGSLSRRQLNNQQMHALAGLCRWRDKVARDEDEGVGWVLPTHMMLHIAESLPRSQQEILACCFPLPPLVKDYVNEIYKLVWSARNLPLEQKPQTLTTNDENRSNLLEKYVDEMNRMTAAKALLRCDIDFSHTNFDEEIGGMSEEMKNGTEQGVEKDAMEKQRVNSYLPVLLGLSGLQKEYSIVDNNKKYKRKLVKTIVEELEDWISPYECYTVMIKQAGESKGKKRKLEEEGGEDTTNANDGQEQGNDDGRARKRLRNASAADHNEK